MDDLSGLDWNTSTNSAFSRTNIQQASAKKDASTLFPSRQQNPISGQQVGNPSSGKTSRSNGAQSSSHDSFASLLSQPASKPQSSLSMQERQRQLQAEKFKQKPDVYNAVDNNVWEGLGSSGRCTPVAADHTRQPPTQPEDDLLSAFSANAHVDSSSHYPPPPQSSSTLSLPNQNFPSRDTNHSPASLTTPSDIASSPFEFNEDDDPFGLGKMDPKEPPPASQTNVDEDDILGELGKPVTETRRVKDQQREGVNKKTASINPQDRALADLVEMGFAPDKAQKALAQTETGTDVQAAVGVLLSQAHEESRGKSKLQTYERSSRAPKGSTRRSSQGRNDEAGPAWMRNPAVNTRAANSQSSAEDKDVGQYASELGTSLFQSANTLWKSGQKKVQKAVAEFQHDTGDAQPKWMQQPQVPRPRPKPEGATVHPSQGTDEAMLLETGRPAPHVPTLPSSRHAVDRGNTHERVEQNKVAPNADRRVPPTTQTQPQSTQPNSRRTDRLTRQAVEDQSAQAYISPARRKKTIPKPDPAPKPEATEPALDIFSSTVQTPEPRSKPLLSASSNGLNGHAKPPSAPPRPRVFQRTAPDVAPGVLATCTRHRAAGADAFRRGDYTSANSSYTSAISSLPKHHPLIIILYCNRALTGLKIGDTKSAINDADAALTIIGSSNGEGEAIALGGDGGDKPMRDFFGKALLRKAEALEHSEKWNEAAHAWREAVHAGVGGAVAIQARNRCEKVSSPSKANSAAVGVKQRAPPKQAPSARAKQSAAAELAGSSKSTSAHSEAVSRLRATNAAAAAASDEAFALTDSVEAKLTTWKAGKADNLRALLASLDTVLWQGAGWQKVGLSDLVMPNKVKIVYMKAISRIPKNATIEQRMISASVFATLNEAWDRFKKDNGL